MSVFCVATLTFTHISFKQDIVNFAMPSKHLGPHLRNERTTENWAYGRSTQNLEFINMDASGGYDQISRQV